MEIQINGAVIILDADSNDIVDYAHLMCVCGHELYRHASWVQWYYPDPYHHTAHQSQCVMCPIKNDKFTCKQFRLRTFDEFMEKSK